MILIGALVAAFTRAALDGARVVFELVLLLAWAIGRLVDLVLKVLEARRQR